jgi:hypothetical protein
LILIRKPIRTERELSCEKLPEKHSHAIESYLS